MKNVKALSIAALAALSLISFGSFAESISVTSSTLDGAESKIAAQAQEQGTQYKITEANTNNRVHMTAELYNNGWSQTDLPDEAAQWAAFFVPDQARRVAGELPVRHHKISAARAIAPRTAKAVL